MKKITRYVARVTQNSRMMVPDSVWPIQKKKNFFFGFVCVALGTFVVGLRIVLFGGVAIYNETFISPN